MQRFELLSRVSMFSALASIGCPQSQSFKKGITLRFMDDGVVFNDVLMKVTGLFNVGGMHCLLGRGTGLFANNWFCIPGNEFVSFSDSVILVVLPYKEHQPFNSLMIQIEESINKVLEPIPA